MGKSSPSPPSAPDPVATANAQAASNAQTAMLTAELNRVNQITPYGTLTYTMLPPTGGGGGGPSGPVDPTYPSGHGPRRISGSGSSDGGDTYRYQPGENRWQAEIQLSPEMKNLFNLQTEGRKRYGEMSLDALDRVRGTLGTPMDFSSLPAINDGVTDRSRVEDALFGRLNPQLESQRNALDVRLRNQGLTPGSEAWEKAFREYGMTENDARLAVIGAAGQEQHRLYGMSADQRARALQEMLTARSVPLNEAAALMGGNQVSYPQFVGVPQTNVQPTDVAGITQNAYNNEMAAYNAQMGQQAGLFGGLSQLGGALLSSRPWTWSDERLKENIHKIGETDDDLPLYLFNYKGNKTPQVGVMAQDVEKRDPGAVREVGGLKMVNLERALLASKSRKGAAAHV